MEILEQVSAGLTAILECLAISYFFNKISGIRLSWIYLIVSLLLALLIPTGFNTLLIVLLLYFLTRREKSSASKTRKFFYVVMPYALVSNFEISFLVYLTAAFGEPIVNDYNWLFNPLAVILVFVSFYLLTKYLKVDFDNIRRYTSQKKLDKLLFPINLSFILYLIITFVLAFLMGFLAAFAEEGFAVPNISEEMASHITSHITIFYSFIYILALFSLSYFIRERQEEELRLNREKQLKDLSDYSHQVEDLYRDVRSFRHDYLNILSSLSSAVAAQDIDLVTSIYNSVLKDSGKNFYQDKYEIGKLGNIKDDAIKSILSAKLIAAQRQGIITDVEIEHAIGAPEMDLLEYVTIMSIFLDNAIEEAVQCNHPKSLSVALKIRAFTILLLKILPKKKE